MSIESFIIGFLAGATVIAFVWIFGEAALTKNLFEAGYDEAVKDIVKFGYFYDKNNKRIRIKIDGGLHEFKGMAKQPSGRELSNGSGSRKGRGYIYGKNQ